MIGATNGETYDDLDPTMNVARNSYIYDNFDWSHCEDDDFDFPALFKKLQRTSKSVMTEELKKEDIIPQHERTQMKFFQEIIADMKRDPHSMEGRIRRERKVRSFNY